MTDRVTVLIGVLGLAVVLVGEPPLSLIVGGGAILIALVDYLFRRFES